MLVRDVMSPAIGSVEPDIDLRDAFEKLRSLDIDPLPVVADGRVVGLLYEDDVGQRAREMGLATSSQHVSDVMRGDVLCCLESQSVHDAVARIEKHSAPESPRRVPVIDADGRLVGLVTLADLRGRIGQQSEEVRAAGEVQSVDQLVHFDDDPVDYMSDSSFPASDPSPPPTTLGPNEQGAQKGQ